MMPSPARSCGHPMTAPAPSSWRAPVRRAQLRALAVMIATGVAATGCAPGSPDDLRVGDVTIRNVSVIDAVEGLREGMTVVVDEGRIVQVAEAGSPDDTWSASTAIDGSGSYLIPGLWDFHAHLTYDARFTEAMPAMFLRHGITSIRDTGGPLRMVQPVVDAMRAEGAFAPRVFYAGPLLDGEFVVYDGENRPELGIANPDVETARANVGRLAEAGVDFIKVYEMVTPEVFSALVEASDALGLPRDGHVPLSMVASDVAPRMQSLEHLRNIELDCAENAEELLEARRAILADHTEGPGADLRSRLHNTQRLAAVDVYDAARCERVMASMTSTIQVPTLRLNALGIQSPLTRDDFADALAEAPLDVREEWGAAAQRAAQSPPARDTTYGAFSLFLIGEMHERGVPIAAGTDTPIGFALPGYSLHSELEMLVRAGLSPLEALRSATVRPAEFFGRTDEMGRVAEGMLADLVLLSDNPLDDISHTRSITAVVAKGEVFLRDELEARARDASR